MNANELNEYIKKAEEGDVNSQVLLGLTYLNGTDEITTNDKEAFKWFKVAAEQGNPIAQFHLGEFYAYGKEVEQDFNEAFKLIKSAAEQGDAEAQFHLGAYYDIGIGITQDYNEAFRWYKAAAEQGHAGGQFDLGVCY